LPLLQGMWCYAFTQMYLLSRMYFRSNSDLYSNEYVPNILW
jgi:hypothetical protein